MDDAAELLLLVCSTWQRNVPMSITVSTVSSDQQRKTASTRLGRPRDPQCKNRAAPEARGSGVNRRGPHQACTARAAASLAGPLP